MVYDKAGNSTFYSASQLASIGLAKSFQVIDRNVTPTATLIGPTYLAEDSTQGAQLTLTLLNVSQASTSVSMSFNAAGSTATNGSDLSVPAFASSYSISQSSAGRYSIALPSIAAIRDQLAEGSETVSITVRAAGFVFDTGTDTKTFAFELIDSGQVGGEGADTLTGTAFADHLIGLGGDDRLRGAAGNDLIEGGSGTDTAVFAGYFRQSMLLAGNASVTVTGPDGRDTLTGVERFQFADGTFVLDPDASYAKVQRLYDTVLSRAPDPIGLDHYVDLIDKRGVALARIADELAGSGEFRVATGGLNNGQFVDYVYRHALGRAPDAGGAAYYTQRLDQGMSRGTFVIDLSESGEHRARTAELTGKGFFDVDNDYASVTLLYDSFLGRLPYRSGLAFYAEQVKSGALTLAQVAGDFAGSAEFRDAVSGKSNAEIVDLVYRNTLDRAPESEGAAYYVDRLNHGLSVSAFVTGGRFQPGTLQSDEQSFSEWG